MRNSLPTVLLLVSGCLLASACTKKTIINEAAATAVTDPVSDTSPTTNTQSTLDTGNTTQSDTTSLIATPVANMIDPAAIVVTQPVVNIPATDTTSINTPLTSDPVTSTNSDTVTTTTSVTGTPVSDNPMITVASDPVSTDTQQVTTTTDTSSVPTVADPIEIITGEAGMTADCKQSLPCRWVSADSGFTVTVTSADNIGRLDRLLIDYAIQTTHDTSIQVSATNSAIDSSGANLSVTSVSLGTSTGGASQGVVAGNELQGSVEFNNSSTNDSLNSWSIVLSDAGLIRTPTFTNLPVGPLTNQIADCQNTLPCAWIPPNSEVTITLLAVSGTGASNLLTTNFSVETTKNATVAVDAGATAVGVDGASYRGRTHSIAQQTSSEKLTATTVVGAQLVASVFFFRTQTMSTALQNLSLITYEDNPVPRWNPTFTNVPVQ